MKVRLRGDVNGMLPVLSWLARAMGGWSSCGRMTSKDDGREFLKLLVIPQQWQLPHHRRFGISSSEGKRSKMKYTNFITNYWYQLDPYTKSSDIFPCPEIYGADVLSLKNVSKSSLSSPDALGASFVESDGNAVGGGGGGAVADTDNA